MATWMVHFRIAENLLNRGLLVSEKEFVVGNIGPDCGLPDEVTGEFFPDKRVTHFKLDGGINPDLFLDQYIMKDRIDFASPRFSFYLGYYLHLVTDVEWSHLHRQKKKEPNYQDILGTPEYTRKIKSDWYGSDFVYVNENKDTIFQHVFQHIKSFPDYLDIFPEGQISKQIKRITDFYLGDSYAFALDPTYRFDYLTPDEISHFVDKTTEKLVAHLQAIFDEETLWDKRQLSVSEG
ncbi:zinc dependent phospholipase C family protein [Rossellomorea aquimaris]|uniref:zinc dependent phospholipase C family protein n=1 Tax=Rossellomorea aquimaris TaxID=189382 RepID=UPI0005C9A0D7|nr:zinc dependent phospholipase C family protein [Rossellomorea aquimaris]